MYQLEVKYHLIAHMFPPSDGWDVTVDIDAMERAMGSQQKEDKKARVQLAEEKLVDLGVTIGADLEYGRADVVARHPEKGTHLVEVEGKSSKQKEQAMYAALGQCILMMGAGSETVTFAVAMPDKPKWERQVAKIPGRVKKILGLECLLVSEKGVRRIQ